MTDSISTYLNIYCLLIFIFGLITILYTSQPTLLLRVSPVGSRVQHSLHSTGDWWRHQQPHESQDWDQEEEEEEDTHQARDWWEERFHPAEVRAMSTLGASLFYYDNLTSDHKSTPQKTENRTFKILVWRFEPWAKRKFVNGLTSKRKDFYDGCSVR